MKKRSLFDFVVHSTPPIQAAPVVSRDQILRGPDIEHTIVVKKSKFENQTIESNLLVDVVRPTKLSDVHGHQDAKKTILHYLLSEKSARIKPCLLVSGPNGCGKTLLSTLCIQETNHVKFELDDSSELEESLQNVSGKKSMNGRPTCAFIECLEGFLTEERSTLLKFAKKSTVATIFTCDDAFDPSMKSFREACLHVRLNQNDNNTILRILFKAGESYGIKLSAESASNILVSSNQNVRLALNTLQLLASTKRTARKGAPLSNADEAFHLFKSCASMCAATPHSSEKAFNVSSGDSDMYLALLQNNCASSLSFPIKPGKTSIALSNMMDVFAQTDLLQKIFLTEQSSSLAIMSVFNNLTISKPEKMASFPQCYSILSSKRTRQERLSVAAGCFYEKFLGEPHEFYVHSASKSKKQVTKQPKSRFVQDIKCPKLVMLSHIRPSGLDAHDILYLLREKTEKRTNFRVLKEDNLYVTGDAVANNWIQKGVFSF